MVVDLIEDTVEPVVDVTATGVTGTTELLAGGSDESSEPTGPGGGVDLDTGFPDTASDGQDQNQDQNTIEIIEDAVQESTDNVQEIVEDQQRQQQQQQQGSAMGTQTLALLALVGLGTAWLIGRRSS